MRKRLSKWKPEPETIVTLGTFDGVHVGHKKLLNQMRREAGKYGLDSLVFTFHQPPKNYLDQKLKLILTPDEKFKLLEKACHHLVIAQFEEIRDLSPEQFVYNVLIKKLNMKALVVGRDFRFGKERRGDVSLLKKLSRKYDFKLTVVEFEKTDGKPVSSTRIRELIGQGQIARAKKLLGYFPQLPGVVIPGKRRGRTLGFPTLNLDIDNRLVTPKQGIYASHTYLSVDDNKQESLLYIGNRPTFGENSKSYEIHLLKQDPGDALLGKEVRAALVSKIRDDRKFPNSKLLTRQISQDVREAKRILQSSTISAD